MTTINPLTMTCPLPLAHYPRVLLAHGSGGELMHQLITTMFAAAFSNPALDRAHDGAVVELPSGRMALTTDGYVVNPLFFPGGDIGMLAIYGTANDLAMCGARPVYLSAGFILEEGLRMETLWRIVLSMKAAADAARVAIVTGDTKVVERGKADGIFITTAGVGVVPHDCVIGPASVEPDDAIILSGDLGRHGMAIMAAREGLRFEPVIESDVAFLGDSVQSLIEAGVPVHCLRDVTRGGLASALVEIARTRGCSMEIDETCIPVPEQVRAACELLGFDPCYVANEGRFICFVPRREAERVVKLLQGHAVTHGACLIGTVTRASGATVTIRNMMGTSRIVEMLPGEQLPRIC